MASTPQPRDVISACCQLVHPQWRVASTYVASEGPKEVTVTFLICSIKPVLRRNTMKPRIYSLQCLARISRPLYTPSVTRSTLTFNYPTVKSCTSVPFRQFVFSARLRLEEKNQYNYSSPNARPAKDLNHDVTKEEQEDYDRKLKNEVKERQIRAPWNREGSDTPPVARQRSAGAMKKGEYTLSRFERLVLTLWCRKTVDDAFTYAQAHPTTHDERHEQ